MEPVLRHLLQLSEDDGGDPLAYYVGEILELSGDGCESLSDDLAATLDAIEDYDPYDQCDWAFYSEAFLYRREDERFGYGAELSDAWKEFEASLKHKRRFFATAALETLNTIMGGPEALAQGDLAVAEVGPGTEFEAVYRARVAKTAAEAERFLANPSLELGSPPKRVAGENRMSAQGIPAFYGAVAHRTALAEVRASGEALVVMGVFRPRNVLRVLDLPEMGRKMGSISLDCFAEDYVFQRGRAEVLAGLHARIIRPLESDADKLDYVPTQAFAEYVADVLGLDGILYGSSLVGALERPEDWDWDDDDKFTVARDKCNIVFFSGETLEYVPGSGRVVLPEAR